MPKKTRAIAPSYTRVELHYIRDAYMTRYRVWQNNWSSDQFELLTYEDFYALEKCTGQFNAIVLIDHTDED